MTSTTACRPRVGLLGLSLELYESLAPGLRVDRDHWVTSQILPALSEHAEVIYEGAVFTREAVAQRVAAMQTANLDAIVILLLTYAPSQIALPALKKTHLPLVIWNTQELFGVGPDYDAAQLTANHGVHGTQDLANVLLRSDVPFHYVTSHLNDDDGLGGLLDFLYAAHAATRVRQARLGLLGYPFPGMGDFAVDTTFLASQLGCSWHHLAVEDFNLRAAGAGDQQVGELVGCYRATYDVAEDVTDHDLACTARAELALRDMIREHRLDGLSYQFMAFGEDERSSTLPFVAASRLMGEGIGFAGEGDLLGAAGHCLLQWLCPPASFSEIFTIDFAHNALFMSHMGEASTAMHRRDQRIALVARPAPITRTRDRQLALLCNFEPGPATLYALAQGPGGKMRIIASAMTIDDFPLLRTDLPVPHFKLICADDVRCWLTRYAQAGGPHHNAVCFGDARPRLRMLAELLDAHYVEI